MRPMGVAVACRLRPHAEMEGDPPVDITRPLLIGHHFKILAFARCIIRLAYSASKIKGCKLSVHA